MTQRVRECALNFLVICDDPVLFDQLHLLSCGNQDRRTYRYRLIRVVGILVQINTKHLVREELVNRTICHFLLVQTAEGL